MGNFRTIKLKKYTDIVEEFEADAAILPGQVLELTSTGKVKKSTDTAGHYPTMVALEDELQGKTTRDSYSSGDQVQCWYVQPGEEFAAIIDSAFDPSIGDFLELGADGELVAASGGTAQYMVMASKEVDDDSTHRIRVKVI